jgi:hypothetical protein
MNGTWPHAQITSMFSTLTAQFIPQTVGPKFFRKVETFCSSSRELMACPETLMLTGSV